MKRSVMLVAIIGFLSFLRLGYAARSEAAVGAQDKTVSEIKRLGGVVQLDATASRAPVIRVNLGGTKIGDAGLARLEALTQLHALDLGGTQVTDAGLEHLQGLTELQSLDLSATQVTDAGLEHLKGLTQLKCLGLSATRVADAGLKQLEGLTQLRELHLRNTNVTDAGPRNLSWRCRTCRSLVRVKGEIKGDYQDWERHAGPTVTKNRECA